MDSTTTEQLTENISWFNVRLLDLLLNLLLWDFPFVRADPLSHFLVRYCCVTRFPPQQYVTSHYHLDISVSADRSFLVLFLFMFMLCFSVCGP
jgi:hypothetical protein